jgi:hypothetical protein
MRALAVTLRTGGVTSHSGDLVERRHRWQTTMADSGKRLEIDEDIAFQRREWRWQRVGRWILTGFVLLAALGLFGNGPLSHATVGNSSDAIRIEFERFVRVGATDRMTLQVRLVAGPDAAPIEVRLTRAYFDGVRIHAITPPPLGIEVGPADVVVRFAPPTGISDTATIVFEVEPIALGRLRGTVRLTGEPALSFSQFAFF